MYYNVIVRFDSSKAYQLGFQTKEEALAAAAEAAERDQVARVDTKED